MDINISDLEVLKIRVTDASTKDDYRAVRKHMRDWQENILARLGGLRALASTDGSLRPKVTEDHARIEEYKEILNGIKAVAERALTSEVKHPIRVIRKEAVVQAATAYYKTKVPQNLFKKFEAGDAEALVETDCLYVGTLATAPWNMQLHAKIDAEEEPLVTKGSGTVLLLSLVKEAFFSGCSHLYLKPLEGSTSFYQYLSMTLTDDASYFYMDLKLKISSVFMKNIAQFTMADGEAALTEIV